MDPSPNAVAHPDCTAALVQLRTGDRRPLATWLRAHLFGHVLPFWERHAFDERGGLLTCLSDAGEVLSTDKWLWSQWRAVWVFAAVYHRLDRDPRWLDRAVRIADFCAGCGWIEAEAGWALTVARDGRVLRGCESTYVDAFAVYGLAELFRGTGDERWRALVVRTADAALQRLAQPHDTIPHFPYPIPPGAKPHGIPMLWSLALAEAGAALGEERYLRAAAGLADEIFRDFFRRDRDLVLEFGRLDGREFPPPQGTAVVPGHVIEDMWFQLRVARLTGHEAVPVEEMLRLARRHLELGWDREHGGLLLAIDADGREPVGWNFVDTKLWWPHTEALITTLLGWRLTAQPAWLDWQERLWSLCLAHFADWTHGEWRQKLDRTWRPITRVVALPVKDPFHLPRSLILQIELLEKSAIFPP
jgi:N-acylglucosamine 2-epimerase